MEVALKGVEGQKGEWSGKEEEDGTGVNDALELLVYNHEEIVDNFSVT